MVPMKKLKRRSFAICLEAALKIIQVGVMQITTLLDETEGSVTTREGPFKGTLTEKELRVIDQRKSKIFDLTQDLRKVARHLWKTSRD